VIEIVEQPLDVPETAVGTEGLTARLRPVNSRGTLEAASGALSTASHHTNMSTSFATTVISSQLAKASSQSGRLSSH
jgi:hypothetical protein